MARQAVGIGHGFTVDTHFAETSEFALGELSKGCGTFSTDRAGNLVIHAQSVGTVSKGLEKIVKGGPVTLLEFEAALLDPIIFPILTTGGNRHNQSDSLRQEKVLRELCPS